MVCCDSSLYPYSPSKVAPIILLVAFFASTAHHVYLNIRCKSWRITATLPWGGLLFIAGFVMREISTFKPNHLPIYIASTCLLLVAPPVFAVTNYIVLGRTLYYVPYLSPIHPGRVISTFLGLDAVIGAITANGGARIFSPDASPSEINTAKGLLQASILLQLFSFLAFVALEGFFHRRCIGQGLVTPKPTPEANEQSKKLRRILYLMYISSAIISSRHIFRVVEVFQGFPHQGPEGYLAQHEWPMYIFDGVFMLINMLMLNIWHPMRYLPSDNKIYLNKDGVTLRQGPGWVDKRPFILTLFDPFNFGGLFTKKGNDRFWDHEEEHPIVGQEMVGIGKGASGDGAAV
ncbi:MAG: hypothetical protein Q9168_006634 [Polycauliona sp. 1 TL-2023]